MYHSYTKKLPESAVLAPEVSDEFDLELDPVERTQSPSIPEDDPDFEAEAGWDDLHDWSDHFDSSDERDTLEEQAEAAKFLLAQKVRQCPVCKEVEQNPHVANCGHILCLKCFIRSFVQVHNVPPYPPCPICRLPVKDLTKLYLNDLVPQSLIVQAEADLAAEEAQAQADYRRMQAEQSDDDFLFDEERARDLDADLNGPGNGGNCLKYL